ncbi:MAG: ABC transporter ATP-binding protein [Planctomycetota bacterium]
MTEPPIQPEVSARVEVSARAFLVRMRRAILDNKWLVASILVAGVADAVCTKGVYLLIKPLIDKLSGRETPPVPTDFGDRLNHWIESFGVTLQGWLGIHFQVGGKDLGIFISCAVVSVLMSVFGALALYWVSVQTRYFGAKVVVDIRNEVADHILHLPLRYFGKRKMGELISNVTTDTAVLLRTFSLALDNAVLDPLMIVMNVVLVVVVVPELSWVLLLMIPLMAIPLLRLGKKVRKRSSRSLQAMGDATESLNQMLGGFRTVRAYQLEDHRLRDFADSNRLFLDRTMSMFRARGMSQATTFFAYQIGFAIMLVALGALFLSETKDPSDLAVLALPLTTTYTHVKRMARAWNTLMESVGAYEGIEALLREPRDTAKDEGKPVSALRGQVEFCGVDFAYGAEPVLRDVSFRVQPGQMVALVGPSGAGKSTALDLLARFYDPQQGRILVDGVDLRSLKVSDYRKHLAIVSQQPFLFNATIFENIQLGRPGASRDEVIAAATTAQIHDFVITQPHGYDTMCGERGTNLSGGQMQRITIARAVLRDPAILILDEATSALDSESEQLVQAALAGLMKGRTSFVIAHRLSTIRAADQILVMEAGRLVECGRHEDLLRLEGLYHRLTQLQTGQIEV